jgi:glycogen(starch) synthase
VRLLLCSHTFAPNTGGIETVGKVLADQFSRLGVEVTVVTNTPGGHVSSSYNIVRQPTLRMLRHLARGADVVVQNNISLRTLLPLLSLRKPVVVAHHTWLTRSNGKRGWQDYLKLAVLPICHNVTISHAVAAALPVKSVVVGNPFDDEEFSSFQGSPRTKDIVFLGRLVSDKGCDLVLRSLSLLRDEGLCPSFSVIGDGPEMTGLRGLANDLGLSSQVAFLGSIQEGRSREVALHKIMVVPSRWAEPFGIVALEGIAAGCALVASSRGGLAEAVGPCGLLFPNGDVKAMALAIRDLLTNPRLREQLCQKSANHLEQFQPDVVAKRYLTVCQIALSGKA